MRVKAERIREKALANKAKNGKSLPLFDNLALA